MPRSELVLRVFVASPDDVEEEQAALEEVVYELNKVRSETRLELIRWEKDCYPGVGSDPQSVINDQITDYDIFIGIMWKKFGSPTPRASSGTAEEFERAYKKYKQDQTSLRIMFYFKDAPPASMNEIDPSQWSLVNEFRSQLGEQGTLYWTFKSLNDFKNLTRLHLDKQIREWGRSWGLHRTPINLTSSDELITSNSMQVDDEIEDGFLDLIELGQDNFDNSKEVIGRMNLAILAISEKLMQGTKEMEGAKTLNGVNIKLARSICDHVADDMDSFAAKMSEEIPLFAKSYSTGIDAWSRAIVLSTDFNKTDEGSLVAKQQEIVALQDTFKGAHVGTVRFRDAVSAWPRITKSINRAKKHTVDVLNLLINELKNASTLNSEIDKVINETIERIKSESKE